MENDNGTKSKRKTSNQVPTKKGIFSETNYRSIAWKNNRHPFLPLLSIFNSQSLYFHNNTLTQNPCGLKRKI